MLVCEEKKVEKHWFGRMLFNYVCDLGESGWSFIPTSYMQIVTVFQS
jgi:hypothetical protein